LLGDCCKMSETETKPTTTTTTTSTEPPKEDKSTLKVIKAPFIEDMAKFIEEQGGQENAMLHLQKTYRELKQLEQSLAVRKANLATKLPDLEQTLDAVKHLQAQRDARKEQAPEERKEQHVRYELGESGIYAEAVLAEDAFEHVNLWLGANVMMEYTLDEAVELLSGNLSSARETIASINNDLDVIKERTVTMEVNMARLYNHEVAKRKQQIAKK